MPLGTELGLNPGDIVLDWDPAPPHGKGHSSLSPPLSKFTDAAYKLRPMSIVTKRWMDQDVTWYDRGRPSPR